MMARKRGSRNDYVYGMHPVGELLRHTPDRVERLYVASSGRTTRLAETAKRATDAGIKVVTVPKRSIIDLVGDVNHQGLVAKTTPFRYVSLEKLVDLAVGKPEGSPLLVFLDQVQDPHNLGAIIRSAHSLGADGVVIPKDRACEITPTVTKVAAGALAHMPIAQVVNLRQAMDYVKLGEEGPVARPSFWVVGLDGTAEAELSHIDLCGPIVLTIGSEGIGLRRLVRESCDMLARVPMPRRETTGTGVDSLNASVAAGIALYECLRQRGAGT